MVYEKLELIPGPSGLCKQDEEGRDFSASDSDVSIKCHVPSGVSETEITAPSKKILLQKIRDAYLELVDKIGNKPKIKEEKSPEQKKENENEWITIGGGATKVHKDQYRTINWKSYTIATRTLLLAVFSRSVLATHSMTGNSSPAFQNKPRKMALDQRKVADVVMEICNRFNISESLVRKIITTKCADECKMMKMRNKKAEEKKHK